MLSRQYLDIVGDGLARLSNSFIDLPNGELIPLSDVATIERVDLPEGYRLECGGILRINSALQLD